MCACARDCGRYGNCQKDGGCEEQAENVKDRLPFCEAKSNDLCRIFLLEQKSRMPSAISYSTAHVRL
jgi:hypothetical protein